MKVETAIFCALLAVAGVAETVKVVDCARDPALDEWAASDAKFARAVMEDVFKAAGVEPVRVPYRADGMSDSSNAVVVCWHTGLEYRGAHEENTERNARNVINAGADLIIINHPHVLQGISVINNRSVFYSLGNFVFGGNSKIETRKFLADQTVTSLYTAVLKVKMTFNNDGKYLGQQITILPALTTGADPVNNYQPRRATAEEAKDIHHAFQRDTLFKLPEVTMDEDGLSKIELGYLAAFDGVEMPESEPDTPQGIPEAANPTPTRSTKGK